MPGTSGCVEHSARGVGAFQDAKSSGRSLAAVMIDLANAFGSVPHAGILYALHWSGRAGAYPELLRLAPCVRTDEGVDNALDPAAGWRLPRLPAVGHHLQSVPEHLVPLVR